MAEKIQLQLRPQKVVPVPEEKKVEHVEIDRSLVENFIRSLQEEGQQDEEKEEKKRGPSILSQLDAILLTALKSILYSSFVLPENIIVKMMR